MLTVGGSDRSADARPTGDARPSRARARIRRGALGGAVVCFALGLVAPGARAQPTRQADDAPELPDSFDSSASATALGVVVLTPPLLPVPGLFEFAVAEGRGTYEPANQEARSSLFFPGNGAVLGPGLACGTAGPQFPPEFAPLFDACLAYRYPLAVYVDSLNPDGQTEGSVALGEAADPVSLRAVGARGHAGIDAATTDAEVQDLRVLGAPAIGSLEGLLQTGGVEAEDPTVVAVEGMTARTDQRIVDGALVVEAEATVSGLRLLGGLVRVGSIVSRSAVTSRAGAAPVIDAAIEVAGVEVAGSPAQLTADGLVLGDPAAPSGPIAQQVARQAAAALEDSGLRFETLPTEEGEIDGVPFATAGGLLIEFDTPIAGLPPVPGPLGDLDVNGDYGVRLQVGRTGVRGFADDFGSDALTARPPSALGAGSPAAPGSGSLSGSPGLAPSGAAAPGPAPATGAPAVEAQPAGLLSDLFADRLPFLYLAFTLTAVALCLAPTLTLPARLPGAR